MNNVNELLEILNDDSYNKNIGTRSFLGKNYIQIRNEQEFSLFITLNYDLCIFKNDVCIKFFLPVGEENVVYILYNNKIGKRIYNYKLCKAVQNISLELE